MHSATIRRLNDVFRTTFAGGRVLLTAGVNALPDMVKVAAMLAVASYSAFDPDNDSVLEHDFGAFDLCQRRFFWKIDYYDPSLEAGSEDPADPAKTLRVLTIMLADEY